MSSKGLKISGRVRLPSQSSFSANDTEHPQNSARVSQNAAALTASRNFRFCEGVEEVDEADEVDELDETSWKISRASV